MRYERRSPPTPDRQPFNPFTRAPLPVIGGRPAALDVLELDRADREVVRSRGAYDARTGDPLYPAQIRRLLLPSIADADRAFAQQVTEASSSGFVEAGPSQNHGGSFVPLDPRLTSAEQFVRGLESVPWFVNLGFPSDTDGSVHRLAGFDAWAGPEDPSSELLMDRFEAWNERDLVAPDVEAIVTTRASWNVAYDLAEDVWYGPNACVVEAAMLTARVVKRLRAGRPIPDDLACCWSWFARGHWPAACDPETERFVVL